jgi:hypothetical protein
MKSARILGMLLIVEEIPWMTSANFRVGCIVLSGLHAVL